MHALETWDSCLALPSLITGFHPWVSSNRQSSCPLSCLSFLSLVSIITSEMKFLLLWIVFCCYYVDSLSPFPDTKSLVWVCISRTSLSTFELKHPLLLQHEFRVTLGKEKPSSPTSLLVASSLENEEIKFSLKLIHHFVSVYVTSKPYAVV
jgi:hypothetical protein